MSKAFVAVALCAAAACPSAAVAQPMCNAVILNANCQLSLDREHPVTPLPVQVKRGSTVTLVVSRRPFERIVTQETAVETAAPDHFAAILAAFLPSLKQGVVERPISPGDLPGAPGATASKAGNLGEAGLPVAQKLDAIRSEQRRIAADIMATEQQVTTIGAALVEMQRARAGEWAVDDLKRFLAEFACAAYLPGPSDPSGCGLAGRLPRQTGGLPEPRRLPTGQMSVLDGDVADARRAFARLDERDRAALREALNLVASDQEWLNSRAKAVAAAQAALASAGASLQALDVDDVSRDEVLTFDSPSPHGASTTTVKLAAQDLVSKVVTPLATVVVNWGGSRWELSTGALLSTIPESTFQVSPVFQQGLSRTDAGGRTIGVITESQARPTVVPVVFAHYRLLERAVTGGTRRLGLLLTGGIGVNPYSGSADFAGGVTLSYRGFVVSPVAHAARPLRLTGGLETGQILIGTPPPLTTERYWAAGFALGISYRIPIK